MLRPHLCELKLNKHARNNRRHDKCAYPPAREKQRYHADRSLHERTYHIGNRIKKARKIQREILRFIEHVRCLFAVIAPVLETDELIVQGIARRRIDFVRCQLIDIVPNTIPNPRQHTERTGNNDIP